MKNLISKVKENWLYLLLPIIFISFFLINKNVVYFGDDYYYLTYRDLSVTDYFSTLADHYQNANGRFIVHMLATFFLKFPLPFWAILNSVFLTGICYFGAKIIASSKKENLPLLCVILFFFLAILDISITRQSVYWLTGSFNYVYPLFLFFAYWLCLTKIENKKFFIASIFLGLLSSATMEQAAMMTFGLTVLVTLSHWEGFHHTKTFLQKNKKRILLCVITLIGLCTVILAPSQFKRIEIETEKETENTSIFATILENSKTIFIQYTISKNILPYCFLFNLITILYAQKNGTKKEKIIFSILAIFHFFITLFNVYFFSSPNIANLLKYSFVLITLLTYGINFIYLTFKIYHTILNPLTITAILLVGSQLMMVISPILGPRNFIFGFVMFAFLIALLANTVSCEKKWIAICFLLGIALISNLKTSQGYSQTKQIEETNQKIIENSAELLKDETQEITLYQFPNDNYGWSMPYMSSYHEFYFKHFNQMKCAIHWEMP